MSSILCLRQDADGRRVPICCKRVELTVFGTLAHVPILTTARYSFSASRDRFCILEMLVGNIGSDHMTIYVYRLRRREAALYPSDLLIDVGSRNSKKSVNSIKLKKAHVV